MTKIRRSNNLSLTQQCVTERKREDGLTPIVVT